MRNKGLGKVKTLELRTLLRLGSGETAGSSSTWAGGWLLTLVVLLLPKQFQRPRIRPEPSLRGPLAPDPHQAPLGHILIISWADTQDESARWDGGGAPFTPPGRNCMHD